MMEGLFSSKTPDLRKATRRNIPEDGILHIASTFSVICLQSCVTVESLLISLPIEAFYVGLKNAIFWEVFTAGLWQHDVIPQ
jgi:hypothetical protein